MLKNIFIFPVGFKGKLPHFRSRGLKQMEVHRLLRQNRCLWQALVEEFRAREGADGAVEDHGKDLGGWVGSIHMPNGRKPRGSLLRVHQSARGVSSIGVFFFVVSGSCARSSYSFQVSSCSLLTVQTAIFRAILQKSSTHNFKMFL